MANLKGNEMASEVIEETTFSFQSMGRWTSHHNIGDEECSECWSGYPSKCKCGGLVHAEFFEEHYDGYDLIYSCDRCSGDYEEAE